MAVLLIAPFLEKRHPSIWGNIYQFVILYQMARNQRQPGHTATSANGSKCFESLPLRFTKAKHFQCTGWLATDPLWGLFQMTFLYWIPSALCPRISRDKPSPKNILFYFPHSFGFTISIPVFPPVFPYSFYLLSKSNVSRGLNKVGKTLEKRIKLWQKDRKTWTKFACAVLRLNVKS